jgi:predicted RNA-binding protein YlqC (UPF0109 family)
MPDRPPEFTDIDLDEEDDQEPGKSPPAEDAPLDPIDFDDEGDDEDEDELDADEESGEAGDVDERDNGDGAPHAAAAPAVAFDEEEEEERGDVRDGIQRAAAVLKYIVENIVDEPDQISIGATEDDRGPVLLLRVAEDDRGKVIGRQGRIVQAIRTVVKAATVGTGEKVSVEIID